MTSDASKFPPKIAKLFRPKPPLRYLPPNDIAPENRQNVYIDGISGLLPSVKDYMAIEYTPSESVQQKQQAEKRAKQQIKRAKLAEDLQKWNPEDDPQIRGNPYRTLFVGRLSYNVTEVDLQKEFSTYGAIERVRVVRDKETNKSKGYGFILFERESELNQACKSADGKVIDGRACIVDVERGRTVKNWKPRRLGGGVGGRGGVATGGRTQISSHKREDNSKRGFRGRHGDGYSRVGDSRSYGYGGRDGSGRYPRERDSRHKEYRERDPKPYVSDRDRERSKFRDQRIENERARGKPRAY
ncbi:U1 snRNP complex subunit [Saccharomycopsis crataegensis]|uniref:U1 snRNP complex subunit n=1 Tax=Saccharomycopsis crataegensis TaxID=43959 RepID=A0AAV5QTJ6_9ASCO|nr:U1 snRNP complex subunit [Saccharomycopsis crataegensis]